MRRHISILGSTGSIGRQSLDVIAACGMTVAALTANRDAALVEAQARRFKPELAVMMDGAAADDLRVRLADTSVRVASGPEGLMEAATLERADTVITAVVGVVGLRPTLAAVERGKRIALANKETLVCGGELVMDGAAAHGAEVVPVDSEHSALFQCLQGCRDRGEVRRLILTASGGPFFGYSRQALERVTLEQALRHPNWSMGAKITVDSATLMNKGLEYIEAMRLYAMPCDKISIVVHRESIVHSLVEYCDNAMLAQLGTADMRLPIQYALTWPARTDAVAGSLDLLSCPPLTFAQPDLDAFPCLRLAMDAARTGGTATAVLNGANEAAVGLFLEGKVRFMDIPAMVERALSRVKSVQTPTLEDILAADAAAREAAVEGMGNR
ncbi:1-deoxy-D-xylulose-5-phosphate reductoisomerase [Pseudoflavonifractor phocaeensis]|uniref:1-deoxy-D-xylulose-5-phosphate reductoisomerase n=1 Tax=Pseudoflavonifractor phocaeensis TaxID=1870988 RepID=UPI00210BC68A|nr:1-deoxy-D-xylulose-5-phosphate reductoisomerase [Pseudoflavonifractor phocaeensis]MCQ4862818.1 1-deoxy-D-xylulose-5-phosphate reductoisomerase [Pseudoflavonifractor phocaeensis]